MILGLIGAFLGFAVAKWAAFPVYAGSILGLVLGFAAGELFKRRMRARRVKASDAG